MGKINNRVVQVRFTKDDYMKLKFISTLKGFPTISEYVRYVTLKQDDEHIQMMKEVHQAIVSKHQKAVS